MKHTLNAVYRNLKHRIDRVLSSYKQGSALKRRVIIVLRNVNAAQKVSLKKMVSISDVPIVARLESGSTFHSQGPKTISEQGKKAEVHVPDLNLYHFNYALVNAKSSCIAIGNQVVYESYHKKERFNLGFIEWHDRSYATVRRNTEEEIDEGFFLAGNGSFNWYHWLIEILPKVLFTDQIPTRVLLVSEFLQKYPSMLDSLKAVIGSAYQLRFLKTDVNYRVKSLYHINAVAYVPFELTENVKLSINDVFMRNNVLQSMRNKILEDLAISSTNKSEKNLYLYRSGHRVPENQIEISETLASLGFKNKKPEELTFQEQVGLFQNAEVIIGTSGAAFSNIIFASKGSRMICFMPYAFKGFACFSNLANIFGVELVYVYYHLEEGKHHYSNNFTIDIEEMTNALTSF